MSQEVELAEMRERPRDALQYKIASTEDDDKGSYNAPSTLKLYFLTLLTSMVFNNCLVSYY